MNKIIKIDPDNRVIVVQPGVINQDLQNEAKKKGFFWPPDPSSAANCTIGGNLACNASGPHAIKYGVTRDNTLGLKAITGTGESIKTGVYTTKGAVGYDLTRLLIGSEGTLAIITEATLKLTPLPEAVITLQAYYKDMTSGTRAVADLMSQPIIPSVLEFLDHKSLQMIEKFSGYTHPKDAKALLIIEVEGLISSMTEIKNKIIKIASNNGLLEIIAAQDEQEIKNIWAMRKKLSPALKTVAPKKINEDVVVPVSQIPFFLDEVAKLSEQYHLTIVNFGHAGNGNIHVNIMLDPTDPLQEKNSKIVLEKIFDLVISLNGTLSGEHGVGLDKMPFISKEIDPISLSLMKQIKQVFDPRNILNPGKILP
jgi:D-lactate dehydrogenase